MRVHAFIAVPTAGALQGQEAEQALTGAVLRVMLARADDDADADAGAAREAAGPAGAVVDLLQTAPHSVPYALRVAMFRQLLSMDKVCPPPHFASRCTCEGSAAAASVLRLGRARHLDRRASTCRQWPRPRGPAPASSHPGPDRWLLAAMHRSMW